MPKNVSAVWDDAYNHSMWVEIYNTSTTATFSLSYYYFTDDLSQPQKWAPNYKLIGPNSYSVLWFENEDRTGHSNFKLDPEGGKLYLLNSSAQIIDSVKYPKQYRNISYGRKTNGSDEWVYFEDFSPGASNNLRKSSNLRCPEPVFNLTAGFYNSTQNASFASPESGDTIYYSTDGTEPTRSNFLYSPGYTLTLNATTILRAKTFSGNKLPSDVVSATYFINERNFKLPVVSIITEQANLTDNTIGIYVQGSNGIIGNGMKSPANWNQDWDRPVNFELFDTTLVSRINQEVDICIAGGWTRMNEVKSFKINPGKKFGNNKLDYNIFAATKPNMKYKSILFRNSGNDFGYSLMRDGYMQSLIANRMNLDNIAYEPAVCFMNGVYYGIQNLRERSDVDYIYSNYGLDDSDISLLESAEMSTDTEFLKLTNYLSNNDITQESVYDNVSNLLDIDNTISYFITEIYYGNTDWPENNIKAWKKKVDGKWRWIFYDSDFGYSLYNTSLYNHNSLTYALGELSSDLPPAWSTAILKRLVLNDTFRKKLIDRFCIQISSTFEYNRSAQIMDSLAAKISNEVVFHKAKWGSDREFTSDISNMKNFASNRPNTMLNFISSRFLGGVDTQTIAISANNAKASYKFNDEAIIDPSINLKYFKNQAASITANSIPGFKFKHWEQSSGSTISTIIPNGSEWKYFDGSATPAANWFSSNYSDSSWKSGAAQLGFGGKGEVTTIGYGGNASNKYTTAYFRKTLTINNLESKSNFSISSYFDDAIAIYVNGTEVGRNNLATGTLTFGTLASSFNNGINATFSIPQNLLNEGENIIAAEVHQINTTSSDLIFNLELTCNAATTTQTITNPTFSTNLSTDITIKAIYEQSIFEDPDKYLNVVFNEIVASNNIIKDEFGNSDDYIELYNNSDYEVNIAGWYLSDTPNFSTLYQMPTSDSLATAIPAKGRLVLWADNEPEQGVLHIGFKLSKDGETLKLTKTNYLGALVLLDSVSFPYMDQNWSYSRIPDGGYEWKITNTTFNLANVNYSGLEEHNIEVAIYPTVVDDYLTIVNAGNNIIRLYDLTAKLLLQKESSSEIERLQLSNLQKGVYIIAIGSNKFKFIKR